MMGERNKVWIELEEPRDAVHAQQLVELGNNMLQRLAGSGVQITHKFSYLESTGRFYYGGSMGELELIDRGHWFNLDHLGRPLETSGGY
jgi:hypothetical protein